MHRQAISKQAMLIASVFLVLLFALLSVRLQTPTGNASNALQPLPILQEDEESQDRKFHAYTLSDLINKFYKVRAVRFPEGECTRIAAELYHSVVGQTLAVTSGYSTGGNERVATYTYGTERTIGSIDMIHGRGLVKEQDANSLLTFNAETVVRIPPDPMKMTRITLDLYGQSDGKLYITKGKFTTPALECSFTSDRGVALCDCTAEPINGQSASTTKT
ncbi:hypothetical protein D6825_01330 [Candidatus Woesearchaeota archaeon]|nr:MAG: hypothetical protein D6825_01330 [Candidatus Woesearchaeota archaeon]